METTNPEPCPMFNRLYRKELYEDFLIVKEMILGEKRNLFDMHHWVQHTSCGAVRCIGGWLSHLLKEKIDRHNYGNGLRLVWYGIYNHYCRKSKADEGEDVLNNLFYPEGLGWVEAMQGEESDPYCATPEEACRAIDLFIADTKLFQFQE